MRKRTALIILISLPLALATLVACSNGNGSAPQITDPSGKHAASTADWVQQHWSAYKAANGGSAQLSVSSSCSECHGADLQGGIAKVSCFQASFQGMECHFNGGEHNLGHPSAWLDPTRSGFHGSPTTMYNGQLVKTNPNLASTQFCGLCHVTDVNTQPAGFAPSCLNQNSGSGLSCHSSSPAVNRSGCFSCHAGPPTGPNGVVRPNRKNAHATHLGLTQLPGLPAITCGSCHFGDGTGTDVHATAASKNNSIAYLNLSSGFRAAVGTFSYVGGKCSAVSCHGGNQTPKWDLSEGGITVATDCLKCHSGLDQPLQYNSFVSGNILGGQNEHLAHLAKTNPLPARNNPYAQALIVCTDCHNLDALTNDRHFGGLGTHALDLTPGTTIGGGSTEVTVYVTTSGGNHTSCTNHCHGYLNQNGSAIPNPARWNSN